MNNQIVEKIQKLLALATSPNEHEARLATEKANELLIKHNLKMQDVQETSNKNYIRFDLDVAGRTSIESKFILQILQVHFFVQPVYSRSRLTGKTTLYILGEETNVEVAKYIYSFLENKFYDLWREYKFANNASTNQKQSYYTGLYKGLDEQLRSRLKKVETETGLIVIRDPKLDELIKDFKRSNNKFDISDKHALNAGYEHGKNIQINKGIETSSGYQGNALEHKK